MGMRMELRSHGVVVIEMTPEIPAIESLQLLQLQSDPQIKGNPVPTSKFLLEAKTKKQVAKVKEL